MIRRRPLSQYGPSCDYEIFAKVRYQLQWAVWEVRQDPRLRWSCTFAAARTRSSHDAWHSALLDTISSGVYHISTPAPWLFTMLFSYLFRAEFLPGFLLSIAFDSIYLTHAQNNNINLRRWMLGRMMGKLLVFTTGGRSPGKPGASQKIIKDTGYAHC